MTKDLGYGWIPISWEGWVIVLMMLVSIIVSALVFVLTAEQSDANLLRNGVIFLITILAVIGLFSYISHKRTRP